MDEPSLDRCLAYVVLKDRHDWLGDPSPCALNSFLHGVQARIQHAGRSVPCWRVFGPLANESFSSPLVARTGDPSLTISWDKALEFVHFSMEEACVELMDLMRAFIKKHGHDASPIGGKWRLSLSDHFHDLAHRPALYFGDNDGWNLRCYLAGMNEGGDWLGLPRVSGLRKAIRSIEQRSTQAYGSSFAAYRVYDAAALMGWAGYDPEGPDPRKQPHWPKTVIEVTSSLDQPVL